MATLLTGPLPRRYLLAPSTSEKDNVTWAGQTLGGRFEVDGLWKGTEDVKTVQCDQTQNMCQVTVPAPGAALVFFSDAAQQAIDPSTTQTFPTTYLTKTVNTVTIDPSVLATSNGNKGMENMLGSTSFGSASGSNAAARVVLPGVVALAAIAAGSMFVLRTFLRPT